MTPRCPICGQDHTEEPYGHGAGLTFEKERQPMADDYVLTQRTFVTADKSRAVPEGDADAAYLLGTAGDAVPHAEALRLGLVRAEAKQVKGPPEDKAAR